jgi:hypothetical protein
MLTITGPYPGTFNTAASEMLVSHTSFSGRIVNQGVIGTGGIVVTDSTVVGALVNNGGTVLVGIHVDSSSRVSPSSTSAAIFLVNSDTFAGGITNAGFWRERRYCRRRGDIFRRHQQPRRDKCQRPRHCGRGACHSAESHRHNRELRRRHQQCSVI